MNLPSLLPKMSCSFLIIFMEKVLWNCIFLAKGCIVEQNSKKETPLKIWFYFQVDINLPMKPFLKLVNDISLIWPKLGKIGFYRPVRTQKLKIFEKFLFGGASLVIWNEKMDWQL